MCGIGEMILVAKCRHVSGTTSAPYTTTTTETTPKATCDMTAFFHGYPLTATNMHLSITAHGTLYTNQVPLNDGVTVDTIHNAKVDCDQGMCAPVDMTGVVNACLALCGQVMSLK